MPGKYSQLRTNVSAVVAFVVAFLVIWAVPSVLELGLSQRYGMIVYLVAGDAIGCALVAILNWRAAAGLFVGLKLAEWAVVRGKLIPISDLPYLTDLVPALVLAVAATAFVRMLGDCEE